jgi:hypothetical protein
MVAFAYPTLIVPALSEHATSDWVPPTWNWPGTVSWYRSTRNDLIDQFRELGQLRAGWLGRESYEIPGETIDRVVAVAGHLEGLRGMPNPEVTPNPNGTISLEWESARGEAYLEYGKTRVSGFVRVEDRPTEYINQVPSIPGSFFLLLRDQLFPLLQSHSLTLNGTGPFRYARSTALDVAEIALQSE